MPILLVFCQYSSFVDRSELTIFIYIFKVSSIIFGTSVIVHAQWCDCLRPARKVILKVTWDIIVNLQLVVTRLVVL